MCGGIEELICSILLIGISNLGGEKRMLHLLGESWSNSKKLSNENLKPKKPVFTGNSATNPIKLNLMPVDKVSFKGQNYTVKKQGNVLQVISFTGTPELPVYGIKSKVRGVTRFQKNCQKILESNWKDGDSIVMRRATNKNGEQLQLIHPQFGMIGRIPEEVAAKLIPLLDKGHKLNFELSDVVGGTIGFSTIGLRVNVKFDIDGDNKIENMGIYGTWANQENAEKVHTDGKIGDNLIIKPAGRNLDIYHEKFGKIGQVYNQDASRIIEAVKANTYKATVSSINKGSKKYPDTVFIKFDFENTAGGDLLKVPEELSTAFTKIAKDPDTKNLSFIYQPLETPEKLLNVLAPKPIVDNILKEIGNAKNILLVGHKSPDGDTIGSVLGLTAALKAVGKNVDCSIDDDITGQFRHKVPGIDENLKKAKDLKGKKYDLAIVVDTPTPQRIGGNGELIKNSKKVIMIDHHPMRQEEWDQDIKKTGVNIEKIRKENLLWVRPEMPAAAQMVASLVFKILPKDILDKLTEKQKQEIAVPLVTGMMTDSGGFARGAEQKVESLAKYLMKWAGFGKKYLRDTINYNIPAPAREKMVQYAKEGVTVEDDIAYGSMQIPYEKFMDVFNIARQYDPEVVKQDVISEFKFSEVFSSLRTDPNTFDDDKIAVSMIQKSSKDVEGQDVIAMSFRSGLETEFARELAEQFGGGGHGAAAGAAVIGTNLDAEIYPDKNNPEDKLTLERKIAQLARELRQAARNNVISFTGWLNKLKMAG